MRRTGDSTMRFLFAALMLAALCASPAWPSVGVIPECHDGVDNDGDGSTDSVDPGCLTMYDASELGTVECDDGIDNDSDGQIDYPDDTGCTGPDDTTEGAPPDTYADILFWIGFENTTAPSTSYTIGADDYNAHTDTVAQFNASASITTGSAAVGSNGLDVGGAGDRIEFDSNPANIDPAEGSIGFWLRFDTSIGGFGSVVYIRSAISDNRIEIRVVASDELEMRQCLSGTCADLATTDANMVAGTWYYVEARWDDANDLREIQINDVTRASSSATYSGPATLARSPDGLRIGDGNGFSTNAEIDNFAISNDYARDFYPLRNATTSPR